MSLIDVLLLISLLLPLVSVLTILLMKADKAESVNNAKIVSLLTSILNLLFSIYIYFNIKQIGYHFGINCLIFNPINLSFSLGVDGISLLFLLLTNFLFIVVFLFINTNNFSKNSFIILLLLEFAVIGTFISVNLWLFYIFFELSVFLIFFLMKNNKNLSYPQYKFLLFNVLGSFIMFICLVYMIYTTKQSNIFSLFAINFSETEQKFLWWGFFLAFAIKTGIFPFHLWVRDTYSNSDNIINMILSGILIKFGIYGLLRIVITAFPIANILYYEIALTLSLITAFYAMFMAFTIDNIKGFLGYFSLSHVGMIVFGIFSLTAPGISGAIFQSISHSILMIGLILVFICIEERTKVSTFSNISGLVYKMPILAIFFMILVLAGMSIPGTNTFVGEYLIFQGVFSRSINYSIIGVLTIIFSAVVILTKYKNVMYGESSKNVIDIYDIKAIETIIFLIISLLVIAIGLYPQVLLNLLNPYVSQVIGFIKSQEVIHGFFKG